MLDHRLTLSLGLRYTREMWDANPGPNGRLMGLDQMPDSGSYDPRFGFALDLFGNNRTVLRGGIGCFSSPNAAQNVASAYLQNGINMLTYKVTNSANGDLFNGILSAASLLKDGGMVSLPDAVAVAQLPASTLTLSTIDPRAKEAQARRGSLELEHDLGHGFVAKLKGTYQKTYNLQYWININMVQGDPVSHTPLANSYYNEGYVPGFNYFTARAGIRSGRATVAGRQLDLNGYGDVYLSKYDGRGEYKSLVFELNRMSSTGFAFNSNITFSSSKDTNSNENSTAGSSFASPFDPSRPLLMTRSDNDTPLRVVLAGKLPPVYGFYVSGTFTWTSGLPWSPIYSGGSGTSSDLNGDDLYNDYALGGRNSRRQPYRKTFDLALTRGIYLPGNLRLDASLQVFNVFNWANQTVANSGVNALYYTGVPGGAVNASFGQLTGLDQKTRELQFNLKLTF